MLRSLGLYKTSSGIIRAQFPEQWLWETNLKTETTVQEQTWNKMANRLAFPDIQNQDEIGTMPENLTPLNF